MNYAFAIYDIEQMKKWKESGLSLDDIATRMCIPLEDVRLVLELGKNETHPAPIRTSVKPTHSQLVTNLVKPGDKILATLTPRNVDLWHMSSGLLGECAEIIELVKSQRFVNRVDLIEELGDIEFYLEGYRQAVGFDHNATFAYVEGVKSIHSSEIYMYICSLTAVCGELFNSTKKMLFYEKPLNLEEVKTHFGHARLALSNIYTKCGFSREQVLNANIEKLLKRYPSGYTNESAQLRADKTSE